MNVTTIDINCDMGEGVGNDEFLMPLISSCNIACGGHAGNMDSMRKTMELALKHNVKIGAHPSYPDRDNFGRCEIKIELNQLQDSLKEQIHSLMTLAQEYGVSLTHIKPHGALYNKMAVDNEYAQLMIDVIQEMDGGFRLVGLSNSLLGSLATEQGISFVHEVFIDRHYQNNGQLVPRSQPNAVISDIELIKNRAVTMALSNSVLSVDNKDVSLIGDTFCIHGDQPQAVAIAQSIVMEFEQRPELTIL